MVGRMVFAALLVVGAVARAGGSAEWLEEHSKGVVETKVFGYLDEMDGPASDESRVDLRLRWELEVPVCEGWRVFVAPEVSWDSGELSAGVLDERDAGGERRPIFHFREAYVEWRDGGWQVRAGMQVFSWGTAEGLNPTDNLNPRDYLDLVANEKIPVGSLAATYYLSDFTWLEGVVVPYFIPSRFAERRGRWGFLRGFPPLPLDYELPETTLGNAQVGLRAHTSVGGWDVSLSYYDGYYDLPRPVPVAGAFGVPLAVRMCYDRVRVGGVDFATTVGDFGIHGELAHTWTVGGRDDSYLQYALGFDYTFADILPGQNLRLVVEWAGVHITDRGSRPGGLPVVRVERELDGALLGKATYEFSEVLKAEVKLAADLKGADNYYVQPSITYDLTDSLRLKAGADFLAGSGRTLFGRFGGNDRFFVVLDYYF